VVTIPVVTSGGNVAFAATPNCADSVNFRGWSRTAACGSSIWAGPTNVKGAFASSPIVVRGAGDLLTAFTVDGDGQLWFASTPTVEGEFMPWRRAVGTGGMSKQFTALRSGNDFEIVYRRP
jgi:hypothetical protein